MKIAHVISGYLPHETTGTQIQLRELCHEQRRGGHEPFVFSRLAGDDDALRDAMTRKAHLVRGIADCAAQIEDIYRVSLGAAAPADS